MTDKSKTEKPKDEKDEEKFLDKLADEIEADKGPSMEYRLLGGTGLKVSVLGYGYFGTFGAKESGDNYIEEAVTNSLPIIEAARNAGINFFDNAETYGKMNGDAEKIMGQGFARLQKKDPKKYRRSDLVFTTKLFWGGPGQNEKGLSRKHVIEGMNASLKRLEMDYVDVVFCHRPDKLTSTLEIVEAFTQLINDGKALYWGTSEWTAQQITEAWWIAKHYKLIAPVVEQPQYHLFERERFEKEYARLYEEPYCIGTTTWSPLCAGWLTGKYNKEIPKGSRLEHYKGMAKGIEEKRKVRVPKIEKFMEFAKERFGCTSTVLAIAWVIKNKNVSVCLLGASKLYQIEENLKAFRVACKMTKDDMKKIEDIFGTKPEDTASFGRTLEKLIETE